ncbi:MAG: DHHA1 domain-containing protein [Parcubacteria group bacterium]|jgi:oligoribonuclease NrnB/cAMP/cGMP phosphodiesterase (DHH superfamily)
MNTLVRKALEARTFVVHEHCADGMASAMLLRAINQKAEVVFCQYGTAQHRELPVGPGMVFADFSPPKDRVPEFVEAGAVVLDHHHTQREVIEAFGEDGVYSDEPGVSGATLVYNHLWLPLVRSGGMTNVVLKDPFAASFATLAGIYDTWQIKDSRWESACVQKEVLTFFSPEELLSPPFTDIIERWPQYLWVGQVLLQKNLRQAAKAARTSYRFTTAKGTRVAVTYLAGYKADAIAECLGAQADLVVGAFYVYDPEHDAYPKLVLSCRSKTDYDVSALCRAYGGGGHTKAAGMTLQVERSDVNPYQFTENVINEYEAR